MWTLVPFRGCMRATVIERRLSALYESAPIEAYRAGMQWYAMARQEASALARRHGVTLACAAGAIAALSPRVHWKVNLRLADAVLGKTYRRGAFKANLAKAVSIRDGAKPLAVLSGPKVRAFYRAIMGDQTAAVIDVWMLRAMGLLKLATGLKPVVYAKLEAILVKVANAYRTTVARLQAIVWTVVRGSAT
jgi:hypothetical protein